MLILGLDPSQSTGWSLYDTAAPLSAIRAGVLRISGEAGEFEANSGLLALSFVRLVKEVGKPDFAVIERAPRQPYGGGKPSKIKFMGEELEETEAGGNGLQSVLSTNQMTAALCAVVGAYQIPFETVMPSAWRKAFLGFGTRKGWQRKDWKRAVRERCTQLKITVTNDDMADAVGIAFAGSSSQIVKMMQAQARAA